MRVALTAQLLKVETKGDRTLVLRFNTQEPSPEEAAQLFTKTMDQVYLVILDESEVQKEQNNNENISESLQF